MAIKVALINMKGGVGKTTLAVNLAWHFAGDMSDLGAKVLLVDLDPQFNASQYVLGNRSYKEMIHDAKAPTVRHIFESSQTPLCHDSIIRNVSIRLTDSWGFTYASSNSQLDLIPSHLELAYTLRKPEKKEHLLAGFISEVEHNYDLILFDCPPTESLFTISAYLASDYILVPVKPEFLSAIGLELLEQSMSEFRENFPDRKLRLAGVVFNTATEYMPEEEETKKSVSQLAKRHDWYVFENNISFSRSYAKGPREGQPISRTSYARFGKANEFRAFAREFQERIGL